MNVNIIVVKWGNKFTPEHVNRLYRMAKRNITLPFTFYCHTEDPTDIYDEIEIIPLDETLDLEKWWWKLTLFKKNSLDGINLYLDLDVVIQNNIDHLFSKVVKDRLTLIFHDEDWDDQIFNNLNPTTAPEYNSSIMLWYNNENQNIYDKFIENIKVYQNVYEGIDRFLTHEMDNSCFIKLDDNEWYFRISFKRQEDIINCESRTIKYPIFDDKGKRIGSKSVRAFYNPSKSFCVFNGCHEDHFYSGMENFLL